MGTSELIVEGYTPEEIRAVRALTLEQLEQRRAGAKVCEEDARHWRQLCEHELNRRAIKSYLEARDP